MSNVRLLLLWRCPGAFQSNGCARNIFCCLNAGLPCNDFRISKRIGPGKSRRRILIHNGAVLVVRCARKRICEINCITVILGDMPGDVCNNLA